MANLDRDKVALQETLKAYRILALKSNSSEHHTRIAELEMEISRDDSSPNIEEENKELIHNFYSKY